MPGIKLAPPARCPRVRFHLASGLLLAASLGSLPALLGAQAGAAPQSDPRVGLGAGWLDAEEAAWNMALRAHLPRPPGFFDAADPGSFDFANTDLAFRDPFVFMGNYHGFLVYDVSDPSNPVLRTALECPGGQGDVSIHGDLLFLSVEQTRGRVDCGVEGTPLEADPERFRGLRIFDVSDVDTPRQIAAVQTCRGSHTHTLVTRPGDTENLWVYVSGTGPVRSGDELEGCNPDRSPEDPTTSYWSIAVIHVPLGAPEEARVVGEPRLFADSGTGTVAGLWAGGDHGPGTQVTRETIQCHDITAYPELGLAAGACSGNGILMDITDPEHPTRIHEVADPNFAYWHSATFNNDGTTILFTDEWGGGSAPRCQAGDPPEWGANALFRVERGRMRLASYYKLPAPQTETENCVAHNGSLVPVPGRDIKVQAWYQGGISVLDFTDPEAPFEIAFFDRGPLSETELMLGGYWSAYWYNGFVYGSEIARGLDVLELLPSEHLSENELAAARLVRQTEFNPQHQARLVWPPDVAVALSWLDQLERGRGMPGDPGVFRGQLLAAEELARGPERRAAMSELAADAWAQARRVEAGEAEGDERRLRGLAQAVLDLAAEGS